MEALSVVPKLIGEIVSLVNTISFNKYRCRDLARRCELFGRYIGRLPQRDFVFIDGLHNTLQECKLYLIKTRNRSRIIYYLNASAIAQDYEYLKKDLDGWLEKINLEMSTLHENFDNPDLRNKDDQEFQKDLDSSKRHCTAAKQILSADTIGENQQNLTVIEENDIQVGPKLHDFIFGTVHDGLYQNKKLVNIRVIGQDVDNYTLSILKRGTLLTWNLQECDYILRTHGLVSKNGRWMIVSERTPNGMLNTMLEYYRLNKKTKIKIATEIALGLLYMHRCNIIHKDLRPHNIAMDRNFTPKITGFELCRDASNATIQIKVDSFVKRWWSPERKKGLNSSKASDVYAFGLILYEISMGSKSMTEVDLDNEYGNIHEKYSEIIRKCLSPNSGNRPDIQYVVNQLTTLQARLY